MKRYRVTSILFCIATFFFLLILAPTSAKASEGERRMAELPIVIIIPSYNNKDFYKSNLDSIFMQDYENYRVIYINDASTDKTGQLVQEYIQKQKQAHRVTLINNKCNKGVMANHYTAVHMCQDHEIIINLDGDDWFKHEKVLQRINEAYQDPDVWLTYGQYEELHYNKQQKKLFTKKGHCVQIPPNIIRAHAYREDKWVVSHLRTFYAGLFKQIKLQDFLDNGKFYQAACDVAFIMPMLEMVKGKFKFIDEILYTYNCTSSLNLYKTKLQRQLHNQHVIRAKEKYKPLKTPYKQEINNKDIDIIIIAQDSPAHLYALLESIALYLSGTKNIYVLHNHNSHNSQDSKEIQDIKHDFSHITYVQYDDLKTSLEEVLQSSDSTYIMLAKENIIIKNFVNLQTCVDLMEQTYAHGFYLSLGKNIERNSALCRKQHIPPHSEIKPGIYAWQFQDGEHDWRNPNNLLMTLYKKEAVTKYLKDMQYNSCISLENNCNKQIFDMQQVGLCFAESKAVALAATEPAELYNSSMKIDITPIFLLKNSSTLLKNNLKFNKREIGN